MPTLSVPNLPIWSRQLIIVLLTCVQLTWLGSVLSCRLQNKRGPKLRGGVTLSSLQTHSGLALPPPGLPGVSISSSLVDSDNKRLWPLWSVSHFLIARWERSAWQRKWGEGREETWRARSFGIMSFLTGVGSKWEKKRRNLVTGFEFQKVHIRWVSQSAVNANKETDEAKQASKVKQRC